MDTATGTMRRWSISALTTLQMCGEKFRRRYIENERWPGGRAAIRGKAVDSAVNDSMETKKTTGDEPIEEKNRDVAATEFEKTWSEGVWLNPEERREDSKKLKATTKDVAVDLAGLHARAVGPNLNPIEVQHRIAVAPADSDIEIIGYLDLIDLQNGTEIIRDTKTKEKAPRSSEANESQQLTMYALLRMAETGRMPDGLALDQLWRTPARGELNYAVQPTQRGKADFDSLVRRINAGIDAVERGVFIPASEDAWNCSAKWCEFYETCAFVRHPIRIAVNEKGKG